jgi:hypothetical protein
MKEDVIPMEHWRVPISANTNGISAAILVTIGPDDPGYEAWDSWLRQHEEGNNRP